jgi:uncharacterized repeat protein (TIGR01451 family)
MRTSVAHVRSDIPGIEKRAFGKRGVALRSMVSVRYPQHGSAFGDERQMMKGNVDRCVIESIARFPGSRHLRIRSFMAAMLQKLPAAILLTTLGVLGAFPVGAQTVTALQDSTCVRDRVGPLNCTANDFTVDATLINGPNSPASCVAGSTVTVEVDLGLSSGSPIRYDVGFFIGQNGNSPTSVGGQCSVATFPETPIPWVDLDVQTGDSCGDFLGSSSATPRIQSVKVVCQGDATTGELLVPYTLVYSNNGAAVCASAANVVPGTNAKCQAGTARVSTFVVNGYVDVTKQTLPDGDATSFGFTASGTVTPAPASFNLTDNNTQRVAMPINGSARQLTIDENVPAHWRSTISCGSGTVNTSNQASGTLVATLQNSSPDAACTITNTKRSRITIQKNVDGRVVAADQFAVSVSGAGSSTLTSTSDLAISAAAAGITTTGTGIGVIAANTFFATPGQALTLTDAMAAGSSSLLSQYDTRLTCTNAFTGSGATVGLPSNQSTSSFSLTPAPGDDITCTYVNSPRPRLSLQKAIAAPGRIANSDQFALTISGTGGPASVTTTGTGTAVTSAAAALTGTAGSTYTLSEAAAGTSSLALYGNSISCSNASAGSGTVLPNGSGTSFNLTPANNDNISCTITNARKSASLRLAKTWSIAAINDTAALSTTGLINNASLNSTANAASETDIGAIVTVYAGETATLAEILGGANGGQYTSSAWSCSGGTLAASSLAINAADAGTTITCTITNTRAMRTVTVTKSLSPSTDSGKFTLQVNGNPVAIDVGNGGSGSVAGVPVGSVVNVAEIAGTGTVLADYLSSLSCSGVSGVSGTTSGSFTLPDNDVTCTFANTRNTATLTLTKSVVNDNGGTALAAAWTLSASGPTPISGTTGSAAVTNATVDLGTYTLAESGPGDYLQTGLACGGAADINPNDGLTLAAGEVVSCQFTNDDQTASLALAKSASVADTNGNTVTGDAGDTITYTFSATNTGTVTLTAVTVSDLLLPGLSCTIAALAPSATASCVATNNTYVITAADVTAGSVVNTATVTGDAPGTIPNATGTDSVTTPTAATPVASLTLDKSASVADTNGNTVTGDAGDTITYSFSVTNTGTVPLAPVTVADPLLPTLVCSVASLAPGATASCTATNNTYVITAADVTAGNVVNTATATGDAPGTIVDPTATDSTTTPTAATPTASLTLDKSASVADTNGNTVTGDAGDTVTYTFSATNTGTVTLSPVTMADPLLPGLSCTIATLAPAVTDTCAATNNTYVITAADVTAGSVVNTATVTGDAPGTIPEATGTDSVTTPTAMPPVASLTLDKTATVADTNGNTVTGDAGDTITYSFSMTNTGTVTLAPVTVADPLLPGLSCTIATLAPSATASCVATNDTYVITAADVTAGQVVNTATTTGDAPGTIVDPTATDSATTPTAATPVASLTLDKSASVADTNGNTVTGDVGDTITYSFSATNTGTVTLAPVTVADPRLPGLSCTISSLAPAATDSCAATGNTYVITAADGTAGSVVNTATATGDAPGTITDPTATDTVITPKVLPPTASLTLDKSASVADTNGNTVTGDAGDTITYTFSATNTGTVTLAPVTVADPLLPGLSCNIASLAPGATASCTATNNAYVITAADVTAGNVVNTATMTGDAPGTIPEATGTDTVTTPTAATPVASLTLDKTATVADTNGNTVTGDVGDTITYSFSATNTGTVTLAPVTVADPRLPGLSCTISSLAPAATASCAATGNTYVITAADGTAGSVVNTATATGDAPGTITDPTATDTVITPKVLPPTASLTLDKSASVVDTNGNTVTGDAGDTITYSFSVTNTGTVTLAPVIVADPLLPTLACNIASLAPGATASCTATNNAYVITAADVTAGNVVNTATATGDAPGTIVDPTATDSTTTPTAATPTASVTLDKSASVVDTNGNTVTGDAGDTITYSFSVTNTGTVTLAPVTVADPLLPALGCTIATLAPSTTASCGATNNTYVITAPDVTAGTVVNTATATGDAPGTIVDPTATDSATTSTAATPTASLTLDKSASVADTNGNTVTGDAGDTITYGFSATNTGTVTLAPVTVSDPLLPTLGCTIATLAPAATASCVATNNTYVITAADVTAGQVVNTATVTGEAPGTIPNATGTDSMTTPTATTPVASLTFDKSASVADTNGNTVTGDAGDTITYTFSATNTGTVTLAPVTVADPLLPTLGCTIATLAPAATASCTASNNTYVITAADVTAGNVVNTATVTGDPPGTIPNATGTDSVTTPTAATPTASLTLDKSASVADTNGNTVTGDAGDTITYTFTATNTGAMTLAPVTVTDPRLPTLVCTIASLAPGVTASCAATNNTHVITAADVTAGTVVNTATATGDAPGTMVDPSTADAVTTPTANRPIAANDDSGTVANGAVGGTAVPNVLANDTLDGQPATLSAVTLSQVSTSNANVTLDATTGAVNAAPGTPAGTYTLTYQVCEVANPDNCDTAVVTVTVSAAPIDAINDDFSATPLNGATGGSATSVLGNDTLNGALVQAANVALTPGAAPTPAAGSITMNVDGTITVASGTTAGTYGYPYTICETLNPANCDTATATIVVGAPAIDAVDDDFSGTAINGAGGGVAGNAFANDTLNGAALDPADVIAAIVTPASNPGVALDTATGIVTVAAGTPVGNYTIVYRLCETLNPGNCDTATITVAVSAAPIDAVDDLVATPVNGATGGTSVTNVLDNDTLDGTVVVPTDVTLNPVTNGSLTVNADGTVDVAPGSPAGTYTVTYQICEVLNPGNCDTGLVTVTIIAPQVVAVDDASITPQNTPVTTSVLGNDTLNGAAILPVDVTVTVATQPANGTTTVNADGTILYTPATNFSGDDSYTYTVCETLNPSNCATALVNVTVQPNVVDAIDDAGEVDAAPVTINAIGNDTTVSAPLDPDSLQVTVAPANGTVSCAAGRCTYSPNNGFAGTDTFTYRVCDMSTPSSVCDTAVDTVTVNATTARLRLVKQAAQHEVKVGDLMRYTVLVENVGDAPASNASLVDTPPAGFTYVDGSLSVDDDNDAGIVSGTHPLRIEGIDVAVGGRATVVYYLRVGAGVGKGIHANSVVALDSDGGTISNVAAAEVEMAGDPLIDNSLLLGTVFDDRDGNGWQDSGERGIPGVRIASVEGLVMETDAYGRYHLEGIPGGDSGRGRNFILKVDPATLPPGSMFTTENPRVRRITPGLPVRFDFGVKLPAGDIGGDKSETEIELGDVLFEPGSAKVKDEYAPMFDTVAAKLREYDGGHITITAQAEEEVLAFARARAVQDALTTRLDPALAARTKVDVVTDVSQSPLVSLGRAIELGTVLFDTDQATIKPHYHDLIVAIATELNKLGQGAIGVIGRADVRGDNDYNAQLGLRRAKAVSEAIAAELTPGVRQKVRLDITEDTNANTGVGGR